MPQGLGRWTFTPSHAWLKRPSRDLFYYPSLSLKETWTRQRLTFGLRYGVVFQPNIECEITITNSEEFSSWLWPKILITFNKNKTFNYITRYSKRLPSKPGRLRQVFDSINNLKSIGRCNGCNSEETYKKIVVHLNISLWPCLGLGLVRFFWSFKTLIIHVRSQFSYSCNHPWKQSKTFHLILWNDVIMLPKRGGFVFMSAPIHLRATRAWPPWL